MQEKVETADGTFISYDSIGTGPGLAIVHGTLRAAKDYEGLAKFLSDTFTVHLVDRRGRGSSGPQGDYYSLAKEVDDIRSVLQSTNTSFLFGHSFGGAVALELSLTYSLSKLALYEPALSIDHPIPVNTLSLITEALAKNNYKLAFMEVMRITGNDEIPEDQLPGFVETLSSYPVWNQMCALLTTVPNEIKAIHETINDYSKYKMILAETLIMYGAKSPFEIVEEMTRLSETIPVSKVMAVDGAGHNAPDMDAPEAVAMILKDWFID